MNTPNPKRPILAKILALVAILTLAVGVFAIPCSANGWQPSVEAYYTPHPLTPYAVGYNGGGYNGSVFRYHTNSFAYPRGTMSTFTDVDNFYVDGASYAETTRLSINSDNPLVRNQRITATFDANYTLAVNGDYCYSTLHWGGFKYDRNTTARSYLPTVMLKYDFERYGEYLAVNAKGTAIKYDDAGVPEEIDVDLQIPYNIGYEYVAPYAYYDVDLDYIFGLLTQRYDCTEYVNLMLTFLPKTAEGDNNVDVTFFGYTIEYSVINEYTPLDTLNTAKTTTVYQQVVNTRTYSDLLDFVGDAMEGFLTTELFTIGNLSVTPMAILGVMLGLAITILCLKFFAGG